MKSITNNITIALLTYSAMAYPSLLSSDEMKSFIIGSDRIDTIQLAVPNQMAMLHGSASCGYQACFNGLKIRDILLNAANREELFKNLRYDLLERTAQFCGKNSPWRSHIIFRRSLRKIQELVRDKLDLSFKDAQADETQRNLLLNQRIPIAGKLARKHAKLNGTEVACTMSAADISETLRQHLEERVKNAAEQKDDPLCQQNLAVYQKLLENLSTLIAFKDLSIKAPAHDDGNWIDSQEIEDMLTNVVHDSMDNFFIVGNNGFGAEDRLSNDEVIKAKAFTDFAEKFQQDDGSLTGIFLVYIKQLTSTPKPIDVSNEQHTYSEATASANDGHWICMVAHKIGNQRQYVLADSLLNCSRLDHYRIKEVRSLLNGIAYTDREFNDWKNSCRPPQSINPTYVQAFVGCALTALAYYVIKTYRSKSKKTTLRSPESLEHDVAIAAC